MSFTSVKNKKQATYALVLYLVFIGFMLFTDPQKLPIVWLLLPFVLLFLALYLTAKFVLVNVRKNSTNKNNTVIASIIAGAPCLVLLLDSVNQLTVRDVFLIIVLAIFGMFYAGRIKISG